MMAAVKKWLEQKAKRLLDFELELVYDCGSLSEQLAASLSAMHYDPSADLWVVTIKDDCWAPGIWAGTEGLPIVWEWTNAPTECFIIKYVDLEKKTMYLKSYTPVA